MFKTAKETLLGIKTVKINGIKFIIRKISIHDHVEGYRVLLKLYDDWNNKRTNDEPTNNAYKKTKEIYTDIFLKAIIKPTFTKDGKGETISVEELFMDWDMAHKLFNEIIINTLGKKKTKFFIYPKIEFASLTS